MTDFFTMPGGVVNLQSEDGIANLDGKERSSMTYVQPPGNTTDDGGTVRFNTIDWERRAKVAADGAAGLEEAIASLVSVAKHNYFGDLVEGKEVYDRLLQLVRTTRERLSHSADELQGLAEKCVDANTDLHDADIQSSAKFNT